MSLKTELKTVWREEMSHLSRLDSETQAWKIQMERINHIEKLLVDLEKSENENDEKVIAREIDEDLRREQIELDKKEAKSKKRMEYVKTFVPVIAACGMGLFSMKWETLQTLTNTAGRCALRDVLKFKI